jgi:hypothetical protein
VNHLAEGFGLRQNLREPLRRRTSRRTPCGRRLHGRAHRRSPRSTFSLSRRRLPPAPRTQMAQAAARKRVDE